MREFARLITEWGIETYGVDSPDRPYGLIMQGQDASFFARAIDPLSATAGSPGFDAGLAEPINTIHRQFLAP